MIDEKQEIVIPEEYRELYENAVLSTGRNFMSAKDVRILIERVAGLIMQAKRDCKSISESKQAFEDLRIADQAALAETLAAALEQSLRAEKAEAERDAAIDHYDNMTKQRDAAIELAAWKPITPETVFDGATWYIVTSLSYGKPWYESLWGADFQRKGAAYHLINIGRTHYRSINAPSIVADGEKEKAH